MPRLKRLLVIVLLFILPVYSHASFPDVSGTYSGSISGIDVDASPPGCEPAGPFSGALTLTLIADTQGNISGGSGTFINSNNGEVDTITITGGGFLTATTFDFNFNTGDGSTGNISFSVSGNTLSLLSGSVNSIECNSTINSGALSKSGSTTIVTSETPGSTVTDALLFNIQVQNTVTGISNRVTGALSALRNFVTPRFTDNQFIMNGAMGLNAGEGIDMPYGVWGNYSYTSYENDLSSTAFDGSNHSFLGGMDFRFWDNTVLGVAVGYDFSDLDTGFNQGEQDTKSYTFAPYFGWVMSEVLSMDFNFGYSYVDYDQFRTAGATRIDSSPTADRWFGSFNLNAITFIDRWIVGGRMGFLYARSTIEEYTESNGIVVGETLVRNGTFSLAGDVAYSFNEWEPFLNLSYQYDYTLQRVVATPQPSNDNNDILLTTGVRYFDNSGISGNLEYSKRFFRENFDEDRFSLTVRMDY